MYLQHIILALQLSLLSVSVLFRFCTMPCGAVGAKLRNACGNMGDVLLSINACKQDGTLMPVLSTGKISSSVKSLCTSLTCHACSPRRLTVWNPLSTLC